MATTTVVGIQNKEGGVAKNLIHKKITTTLSPKSVKIKTEVPPIHVVFPSELPSFATVTPKNTNPVPNPNIKPPNLILVDKDVSSNSKYDSSSFIVLSIGFSCAFVLLVFIIFSLRLLKKSRYCSKVYINYDLANPKSNLIKPMRPAILSGETILDNTIADEMESPREPIYFEQEVGSNTPTLHSKYSISVESCDSGIDNLAFTDVSSNEGKSHSKKFMLTKKKSTSKVQLCPKYMAKKKKLLVDSSLKVCSSDGSIFPASPSLTKCLIPPPPYFSNIHNDGSKSSTSQQNKDSLCKNPINSISESCDDLPKWSPALK